MACLTVVHPRAATVTAASCSQAHVQAAVDGASSGDTVTIPAGSCTWATQVAISSKALKIVGAGVGVTNITDNTSDATALYVSGVSSAHFLDLSNLTLIKQQTHAFGMIIVTGVLSTFEEPGFRIHHLRLFDNGIAGGRGIYTSSTNGLIDHVTFDITDTVGSDQVISVEGTSLGSDGGYTAWMKPLSFGSIKAVYIEDCTFNVSSQSEDAIDAYSGARLVMRHNVVNGTSFGFHGTDSGGNRGPVSVEMYANTFTNNSGNDLRATTNRGGTALYFDNTFGGSHGYFDFIPMVYRATIGGVSWADADGAQYDIGSIDFSTNASRTNVTYGTVARFLVSNPDTVCAGVATGDCIRAFDGTGSRGYPLRDQPGRGPNGQTIAPLYAWNNGAVGITPYDGGCGICAGFPIATWIAANRDYYNYVSSGFDGTTGVGRGTVASRPATCTAGVAYWATDQGEWDLTNSTTDGWLYTCQANNVWAVYYRPFVYPHPLTGVSRRLR